MITRNPLLMAVLVASLIATVTTAQEPPGSTKNVASAIFAGGCFWCVEQALDEIPGVLQTISGYTGGTLDNPTYEQVSAGGTGHYEAVLVRYDPGKVGYRTLLRNFWRNIDPVDAGGQFCDRGPSYRSAIFVQNPREGELAQASKRNVADQLEQPIATPILPASTFYPAEAHHQDYYEKNPLRYRYYKWRCGRQERLEALWGKEAGGAGP